MMIEQWYCELNESIRQGAGVLELSCYDHSQDRYETYCGDVVGFFVFGTPRAEYDFGTGYINNAIEENVRLMLLMNVRTEI